MTNTTRDKAQGTQPTHMDDAALVAAAKEDRAAFDVLYRRYAARVYSYCYSRTENAQAAENLTAQTFLAALEGISGFRGDGSVAAWLFGIAANVCRGYHRYRQRHPQEPLETAAQRADADTPDPERRAYRQGILECAQRVLPLISEGRQEVVRLRFLAGLNTAETAAVMGKRRSAVRKLLSRAIDDLRERCLDEDE
ncbi:MAG TPA: RNA polymerase sigma factor [Candidatus Sulfomarinibacteraceae bacterium]|nr:RNA polymerase sigma factor [Candidatus Sulfomarinibacteraceae bacterium]